MEKNKKIIFFSYCLGVLLFLFFIGSSIIVNPFLGDINVIDEGQFAAWLMHMLHGEHLYINTYAAYGPFYIYPMYLLAKVFTPSIFLIRMVYIVGNTFLAILIAKHVLEKLKIPFYLQLFSTTLLLLIPGFGMRQGIGFLAILLLFSAFEKKSNVHTIIAGVMAASAFLVSSEIGIFVVVLYLLFFTFKVFFAKDLQAVFKKIFLILLGGIFVWLSFYFWSSSEGWFHAYIVTIFDDLATYSGIGLPNGKSFPNAIELMPHAWSLLLWAKYIVSKELLLYWLFFFYICTFCFLFIKTSLKKLQTEDSLVLYITLYGFFLSMILIGRYGHFAFTLSPVFIVFAYFLQRLIRLYEKSKRKYEKILSVFLITVICLFSIRILLIYRPQFYRVFAISQALIEAKNAPSRVGFISISRTQQKSILTLQKFIHSHTKPSDEVFFFNNEPAMYFLVDRENPTRYDLPEVAISLDKRLEIKNDLIKAKPKYIIDDNQAWSVDDISNKRRLPEVIAFIEKHYSKEKLENFTVYTLKDY